ncbi:MULTISPECIES: nitroreductase family protein [unclassified Archaeoglobus]|jgi:nitroreductase|uniref:nitroreductase family protein n=1 Tax=unclassified Archaeoglobus TaxID=2643606 RepID=UPI0025B993BD|nr:MULTISPECIES: nitroreductase family protein [unclassified Archaeoglobus]
MEVEEAIRGRRSVRKYVEKDVPQEDVVKMIDAARWAPSWSNFQCWEFVVVRDRKVREELLECIPKFNPGRKAVETAPVVIAVLGKKGLSGTVGGSYVTEKGDWLMFDTALAVQNLCLQAYSMGYGTLIVGLFDFERASKVLGVPDDYELVVLVTVGSLHKIPNPPERKEVQEIMHLDTFGNRLKV